MNLKKITDPEEILLLWQAGLIVGHHGGRWVDHDLYLKAFPETFLGGWRNAYNLNNAYVIVEEDGSPTTEE